MSQGNDGLHPLPQGERDAEEVVGPVEWGREERPGKIHALGERGYGDS